MSGVNLPVLRLAIVTDLGVPVYDHDFHPATAGRVSTVRCISAAFLQCLVRSSPTIGQTLAVAFHGAAGFTARPDACAMCRT